MKLKQQKLEAGKQIIEENYIYMPVLQKYIAVHGNMFSKEEKDFFNKDKNNEEN